MVGRKPIKRTLRDDCIAQALAIIDHEGVEKMSLREVARRLGVSHQAPYKHFASRDHLLAEIVAGAFATFAAHLDSHPRSGAPHADMEAMGRAYITYALEHPLNYRLMFGTPLPDPDAHPEMMHQARHAFALLKERLNSVRAAQGRVVDEDALSLEAMFVWSTMHGLAGIMSGDAMARLGLSPTAIAATPEYTLARIGKALGDADR